MSSTSNAVPYLERLSARAKDPGRIKAVQAAIEAKGFWEEFIEWRLSIVTSLRIERIRKRVLNEDADWYRVCVKCDSELMCDCPTIERAVEYLGVFEHLVADLFWTLGWPSWASYGRMKH